MCRSNSANVEKGMSMNIIEFNTVSNLYSGSLKNKNDLSFRAKFPINDINNLISEQHKFGKNQLPSYPQIYTFLEYLAEIPGNVARLVKGDSYGGGWSTPGFYPRIEIDGQLFKESNSCSGYCWYDVLKSSILDGTEKTFGMPKSVFEQTWWKHRNVTVDDIRKMALNA